jgi:hypothetical protein
MHPSFISEIYNLSVNNPLKNMGADIVWYILAIPVNKKLINVE